MTPANAFEIDVGHFWGLFHTRDYMRARFALADMLRRIGNLDGGAEALSHLQDTMRLCRSANMGVRDLVAPMMVQLDRDQESYGFITWYEIKDQRSDYDWGDVESPFSNVKNENPVEDVEIMNRRFGSLNYVSAVTLLKMKLMVDCSAIRLTQRVLAGKLPVELWRIVEQYVVRSHISVSFIMKNSRELAVIEDELALQIRRLGVVLGNVNEHFVGGLLEPDDFLKTRPGHFSGGSVEEMMNTLQYSFPA